MLVGKATLLTLFQAIRNGVEVRSQLSILKQFK